MPNQPLARLLIVDDEANQRKALCNTLSAQGYVTNGCSCATEALEALAKESYDLLLTDLMMPEIDGIGLLNRALAVDRTLVGIVMTGHGTIDTAVQAMKSGALDYILKPFKLSVILPVISRALEVRRLRLEKAALEQRVRERTSDLEAANHELEAFAHSVSHDLRAPLRHVEGYTKLVLSDFSGQLPPDAQHLLNLSLASARRMGQLIEDLLRLSRLGRQPLTKERVNVLAMAKEISAELLNQDNKDKRQVSIKIGELTDCTGDPSLLRQVFINLLANALKFTRQKPNALIEVSCSAEPGQIVYAVCDNGVGFDMQYADRLFAVFERLHPSNEFEGNGVGLSLVQRIVHRHGGRVWAKGEPNKGASFYFTMPG